MLVRGRHQGKQSRHHYWICVTIAVRFVSPSLWGLCHHLCRCSVVLAGQSLSALVWLWCVGLCFPGSDSKEPSWLPAELVCRIPCPCYQPICTAGSLLHVSPLLFFKRPGFYTWDYLTFKLSEHGPGACSLCGGSCAVTCARIVWGFVKGLLKVENQVRIHSAEL